jgi:hypothetical protein
MIYMTMFYYELLKVMDRSSPMFDNCQANDLRVVTSLGLASLLKK